MLNAIFRKTALGQQLFIERSEQVTRAERNVLIMVDGKKTLQQLIVVIPPGESLQSLAQHLLDIGCIEYVEGASPNPTKIQTPVVAPSQSASVGSAARVGSPVPAQGLVFVEVRKLASRMLTDQLGPQAEVICIAIEKSKTSQELLTAVQRGANALQRSKGDAAALKYLTATAERLV